MLKRRVYFVHNWRHDVAMVLGVNGRVPRSPAKAGDSAEQLAEYDLR